MNDRNIRPLLLNTLENQHVVEELTLSATRIDLAVVGPQWLTGYEIKGEGDSVRLLGSQVKAYTRACQFANLVCHPRHTKKALDIVPEWWGVLEVTEEKGVYTFRAPGHNPQLDIEGLLELFWSDELRDRLTSRGIKAKSLNCDKMRQRLATDECSAISAYLCDCLRQRGDWRIQAKEQTRLYNWRYGEGSPTFGRSGTPPDDWNPIKPTGIHLPT